jgi:hypothetical protein
MRKVLINLWPQKIDTKIFQYACLAAIFLYGTYSFWFSFSTNKEEMLSRPLDLTILGMISLVFPLSLMIIFNLINFFHFQFLKHFEPSTNNVRFTFLSPVNWHFFGLLQAFVISINWMILTVPSYFTNPSIWKILGSNEVLFVNKLYLISLSLIWICLLVGTILLFRRKLVGKNVILSAFLICLLGCIKKIMEPQQFEVTIFENLL